MSNSQLYQQAGYDTIHLKLAKSEIEGGFKFEDLNEAVNYFRHRCNKENGLTCEADKEKIDFAADDETSGIKGKAMFLYPNLKPCYSDYITIIIPSAVKYIHGKPLRSVATLSDIRDIIDFFAGYLNLPLESATITRVDIAATVEMPRPVEEYFKYLGELDDFGRAIHKVKTLYYNENKGKNTVCFYDKYNELKSKNLLPDGIPSGSHWLRYEFRITDLGKEFGTDETFPCSFLWNEEFFKIAVQYWVEKYHRIRKLPKIKWDAVFEKQGGLTDAATLSWICTNYNTFNDFKNSVNERLNEHIKNEPARAKADRKNNLQDVITRLEGIHSKNTLFNYGIIQELNDKIETAAAPYHAPKAPNGDVAKSTSKDMKTDVAKSTSKDVKTDVAKSTSKDVKTDVAKSTSKDMKTDVAKSTSKNK